MSGSKLFSLLVEESTSSRFAVIMQGFSNSLSNQLSRFLRSKNSRYTCETTVAGQIDCEKVARGVVKYIGLDSIVDVEERGQQGLEPPGLWEATRIVKQSPDITGGERVDTEDFHVELGDQRIICPSHDEHWVDVLTTGAALKQGIALPR